MKNNKKRLFEIMSKIDKSFGLTEDYDHSHDEEEVAKKYLEKQKEIEGIWDDEKEMIALKKAIEDKKHDGN